MSAAGHAVGAATGRRRRWLRRLGVLLTLILLSSLLLRWLLQPEQLLPLLFDRVGQALDLEISADGEGEVRLRGEPQLVVRGLVAREPNAATPILSADRLLLALPWSSIRDGGKTPTVSRIELDAPVLNVPALQTWLAKRPPSEETRIPTLTEGLRVHRGRIDNDDWSIEDIHVVLPAMRPDAPVEAGIRGRYLDAPLTIPFDLAVAMSRPANDAGLAVVGEIRLERGDWRVPAFVKLSGPLHLGDDELRVAQARLGVSARYESGDTRLPFSLGMYGPLQFDEATWVFAPVSMIFRGEEALPAFDANGALALGRRLVIELDGTLPRWPERWPALPPPVSSSRSPLPFALHYAEKPDLSGVAGLRLRRDTTEFDARFRLYDVLTWSERDDGSPLPPMDGHLRSPALLISGATLEGVEIELEDPDVP